MAKLRRVNSSSRSGSGGPFALPLGARVRTGATYGVLMGATFSVFAMFNAFFHGGGVRTRNGDGVALLLVLVLYLALGPLTGALFGVFFPLMRRRVAAYGIGVLVSLPVATFLYLVLRSPGPELDRAALFASAMLALLLGGIGGILVRAITLWQPSGA